ncbi:MAG: RNA-binding protein [Lachnospiraceae bacterium]|nr:RNA-binding protein [Lachnospiraceae bacterium]
MNDADFMESRVRELSARAYRNNYLTHTSFLGSAEQAAFFDALRKLGVPKNVPEVNGSRYLLNGGHPDAERVMAIFLPSYLTEEDFLNSENENPAVISCIKAEPLLRKFSDDLTHRDVLGALMNLGIERETVGDILIDREEASAYIFLASELTNLVEEELIRIRHTSVKCSAIPLSACSASPEFEIREGSVASERLDAVIGFVFRLARGKAQTLISREAVFVDGRLAVSVGMTLKPRNRVSVRGFGKFVYEGMMSETKKGRSVVRVRVYR